MSLSTILNAAAAGITNTDYQIAVTNNNIANASDPNYTTKSATSAPLTSIMALSSSTTTRAANAFLTKAVVSSASDAARDQAISDSLNNYDTALGSVSAGDDISSQLTALQTSLTSLSSDGAASPDKAGAAAAAQTLASSIRSLSGNVQTLRGQANTAIADTVGEINTAASQIASLNHQILSASATGSDVTTMEDQRDTALQTLSNDLGVTYYTTPDNQVQVYTTGGEMLVGPGASTLSYTASSSVTASSTYPTQISGIMLNGNDITASLTTGKLAGLVTLRDQTYPQEQAKLDAFAQTLIKTANAASNAGTAYPPPSSLTGSASVNPTDGFSAIGTLRVAVTDSTGAVVSTQDIDLSGMSTVSDLVDALNGVSGLSASLNAQGQLSVSTTNSSQGVALADIGAAVAPNGSGVSAYFGLNNLFSGTNATNIALNANIAANPSELPTATLSTASGLAAGQVAVASADTSAADALNTALSGAASFSAAGNFPAQSSSLQSYASAFVSNAATLISNASSTAKGSEATFTAAQTQLQNLTSVNTNEELANLQGYEQQYQANAQLISTVRTLFTTLMTMMAA